MPTLKPSSPPPEPLVTTQSAGAIGGEGFRNEPLVGLIDQGGARVQIGELEIMGYIDEVDMIQRNREANCRRTH